MEPESQYSQGETMRLSSLTVNVLVFLAPQFSAVSLYLDLLSDVTVCPDVPLTLLTNADPCKSIIAVVKYVFMDDMSAVSREVVVWHSQDLDGM